MMTVSAFGVALRRDKWLLLHSRLPHNLGMAIHTPVPGARRTGRLRHSPGTSNACRHIWLVHSQFRPTVVNLILCNVLSFNAHGSVTFKKKSQLRKARQMEKLCPPPPRTHSTPPTHTHPTPANNPVDLKTLSMQL